MEHDWDALLRGDEGSDDVRHLCAECDVEHRGLPDLAFRLPDAIFALDPSERAGRVRDSSDLCILDDDRHWIRAVLPVPVVATDFEYCFGVWVEVRADDFARYREHFDGDPPAGEGPYGGRLANAIPGYDDDAPDVRAHLLPDGKRPRLEVSASDGALARDQRDGVELADLLRILQPFIDMEES